jgi:hypothetical protein
MAPIWTGKHVTMTLGSSSTVERNLTILPRMEVCREVPVMTQAATEAQQEEPE